MESEDLHIEESEEIVVETENEEKTSCDKVVFRNKIMKVVDNGSELLHYYTMFSPKLEIWYKAAHLEHGIIKKDIKMDYAIFPKRWFYRVNQFPKIKIYDYCFLGSFKIDEITRQSRKWIVPFIKNKFTRNSYLLFTDHKTKINYKQTGTYDFTLKRKGFVPKEVKKEKRNFFDKNYYEKMSQSKFVLCPAGDLFWSMRFYEALMCKTIPIVKSVDETFRSYEESLLGYKYYLTTDEHIYREDWTEHNYQLFLKHHLLNKENMGVDEMKKDEKVEMKQEKVEQPVPLNRNQMDRRKMRNKLLRLIKLKNMLLKMNHPQK
jgi:hypothetical protein